MVQEGEDIMSVRVRAPDGVTVDLPARELTFEEVIKALRTAGVVVPEQTEPQPHLRLVHDDEAAGN
jgi:hypothetical protein